MLQQPDIAKLLLRLSLGVLILFHGVHKLIYGIDGVKAMVVAHGLPSFFAYGVYVGGAYRTYFYHTWTLRQSGCGSFGF